MIPGKLSDVISMTSGRQSGTRSEMTYMGSHQLCPTNTRLCYLAGRSVCWPDSILATHASPTRIAWILQPDHNVPLAGLT